MIISVIGSGGKTTKIKQLKDRYLKEGKGVLMTTSTHMKIEENTLVDPSYEEIINEIKKHGYVHAGSKAKNQKIKALDDEVLEKLKKEIDVILIEADGSHGLPLKYPRNHEPVVDKDSNEIILITSLKGLGKPAQDVVHGYQEMKVDGNQRVDSLFIQQLINIYLKKIDKYNVPIKIQVNEASSLYENALASLLEDQKEVTLINEEWFLPQPKLVILGAGHVSQYVNKLASMLDFYTIVIDERKEFACKELFPEANEIHCVSFDKADSYFPKETNTCYVIVTRGHKDDRLCLKKTLFLQSLYVGMIGSKKKVRQTYDALLEEGYQQVELDKVHAPIGLSIKAITPAEIAVSIMSEIIAIKNEHQYSSITNDLLEVQGDGVLCIIIDKKGSTPRTVGSMMFVNEKELVGSIGGGREEYQAILDAKNCQKVMMKHYELNNSESANLGMICGGSNDVLFLPIKQH